MLCHIKDIISKAKKGGYAVGAFNVHNFESILGVAQAAVRADSPVIIQVSEGAIEYLGLKVAVHIVSTVAKNVATNVPIALHLDHGKNLATVFECIKNGFSSVHIDASNLPLDENIKLTKEVVEVAHRKGVWVQGEVGAIMGGHGQIGGEIKNIPLAKLEEVIEFARKTKVDTIAAAVGTAHGVFTNEKINFKLLQAIKNKTKKTFVLHGGSGVPDRDIKRAIREGVNIINIGTDIKLAFSQTLINNCLKNPKETDPRNLLRPTIGAVEKVVFDKINLFRSK
jgi:fructose-bisphosphate aldolase class II